MADWVLRGNLKGPQGDPGKDAQLPDGGTTGQVLTKTADGEAWQDAPEADMTGVLKAESVDTVGEVISKIGSDGQAVRLDSIVIAADPSNLSGPISGISANNDSSTVMATHSGHLVGFGVHSGGALIAIDSKNVTSITDAISDNNQDSSTELVTGLAVKNYISENFINSLKINNEDMLTDFNGSDLIHVGIARGPNNSAEIGVPNINDGYVARLVLNAESGSEIIMNGKTATGIADPDELVAYVNNYGGGA